MGSGDTVVATEAPLRLVSKILDAKILDAIDMVALVGEQFCAIDAMMKFRDV